MPHDVQKAKTLLTSYREFTKSITPEQQIIWDAVEPKKGKKHAYIPNSVWASKEQMEHQQRYITYGDASEPEEAFKTYSTNIQKEILTQKLLEACLPRISLQVLAGKAQLCYA